MSSARLSFAVTSSNWRPDMISSFWLWLAGAIAPRAKRSGCLMRIEQ